MNMTKNWLVGWLQSCIVLLCLCEILLAMTRDLYPELHTLATNQNAVHNKRQIVLLVEGLGLANRLRSLADWYVLASLTNRKLVVSWRATLDCNSKFSDLFEDWPVGLEILREPLPLCPEGFNWLEQAARTRGYTTFKFDGSDDSNDFWKVNGSNWVKQDILFSKEIDLIFTNVLGLLTLDDIPCTIYKHLRAKFLRSLVPVRNIRHAVQKVYEDKFVGNLVVGVHMRIHNASFDWPMVAVPGKDEAEVLGANVTVEHYVSIMHRIYRKFGYSMNSSTNSMSSEEAFTLKNNSRLLPKKSRVRFYIVSNDPSAKDQVLRYFSGDAAFQTVVNDYSRSSTEGIQNALIEFLLLAKSNMVVQTYGSSYSLEAAALGSLPVASVLSHAVFYRDSHLHQYCGDTLVSRSQLWNDTSYPEGISIEGTFDNRVVSVKYTVLYSCNELENWGLVSEPNQLPIYCYKRPINT